MYQSISLSPSSIDSQVNRPTSHRRSLLATMRTETGPVIFLMLNATLPMLNATLPMLNATPPMLNATAAPAGNGTGGACDACDCGGAWVACTTPDTLDAPPLVPKPEAVTEMTLIDSGLRTLSNDTFAGNPLLNHLELRGNPLDCICSNAWIFAENPLHRRGAHRGLAVEGGKTCRLPDGLCAVPDVKMHPEVISVKEGEAFEVNCSAAGKPDPQLTWKWGAEDAKERVVEELTGDSLRLRIPSARWNDHGRNMTCVATNDAGRSLALLVLNVFFLPRLTPMKAEGQNRCFWVISNPPARVHWLFEDKPLEESGLIRLTQDCIPTMRPHEKKCCLKVDLATYSHDGEYTLVAENSLGRENRSMEVQFMLGKPAELAQERGRTRPHNFPVLLPRNNGSVHFYEQHGSKPIVLGALWVVLISCSMSLLVIGVPIFVLLRVKRCRNGSRFIRRPAGTDPEAPHEFHPRLIQENPLYDEDISSASTTDPSHPRLVEIPVHALDLKRLLGVGNFGKVYFAVFTPEDGEGKEAFDVAVKFLKEGSSEEQKREIQREAQMLARMRHPNILELLGIVRSQTIGIVSEFMPLGDLNSYLRKRGPDSGMLGGEGGSEAQLGQLGLEDLVNVAIQVGSGMKYLSEQHFVHRDLATRNCLVGENLTVKIGDFGMSRDVYSSDYYRHDPDYNSADDNTLKKLQQKKCIVKIENMIRMNNAKDK
ncbi:unnamed protein product [Darwinula stevensoni]|uniref:Tyrosine-protein kinase receptor n=1 Tax=Darwinula stevensoni TaxID=69355 RepID=A0A7R8XEX3_9CRUS|nr:unnamed protein product [Darwinula stevensoni]CAG0895716.1 unnamed protein product [Darwinula stevensoni]